ncbi:MAG TPA: PHP domain-containing protein [Candidatus Gastranaerophilales bacterium]|nr:PHP domain-containing protein [Candidatus Gastranaerophilales bacterium]
MKIDLHIHSIYSDGALSPEEIVDTALDLDLSAISIADHDNILAYKFAQAHARKKSEETGKPILEVIPGIEINTMHGEEEIHVLGYFFNPDNKSLLDMISYQQHARLEQLSQIVKNLNKIAGIKISMDDITSLVHEGGSVGRPHMAKAILKVGGVSSIIEAYRKYINDKSPTYIQRKTIPPHEAVEIIYEAGGIPVVAHPHSLNNAEELIKELMNYGLRGVEAYHRRHSPAMIEYFSNIAENYNLVVTGGSDCHGSRFGGQIHLGKTHVPDWVLQELKNEKNRLEIASA